MAKTFTAPFAQTQKTAQAVATTAFTLTGTNSLLDDAPTNTVLLLTAGTEGAIVTNLKAIPRATNTATGAHLFIRKAADGAGVRKNIDAVALTAFTVATTTAPPSTAFASISEGTPLRLAAGDELYVGLAVTQANGIRFVANYVDF